MINPGNRINMAALILLSPLNGQGRAIRMIYSALTRARP